MKSLHEIASRKQAYVYFKTFYSSFKEIKIAKSELEKPISSDIKLTLLQQIISHYSKAIFAFKHCDSLKNDYPKTLGLLQKEQKQHEEMLKHITQGKTDNKAHQPQEKKPTLQKTALIESPIAKTPKPTYVLKEITEYRGPTNKNPSSSKSKSVTRSTSMLIFKEQPKKPKSDRFAAFDALMEEMDKKESKTPNTNPQ